MRDHRHGQVQVISAAAATAAAPSGAMQTEKLSVDEVMMGQILMSLKQGMTYAHEWDTVTSTANLQHTRAGGERSSLPYKLKVDLSVKTPGDDEVNAPRGFTTISPMASSLYHAGAAPPAMSPTERGRRYGPVVELEDLRKCFNMPIAAVARKFGICATLLKKICRRHGIQRWPHRQIRSLQKSIDMLKDSLSNAKGSNRDYIQKKIAAFEYTLECIMRDPNTAARGISTGRLASPSSEELIKRANRSKSVHLAEVTYDRQPREEVDDEEDEDEEAGAHVTAETAVAPMSIKSILC